MIYVLIFLGTALLSFIFAVVTSKFAAAHSFIDQPGDPRKIHKKPIPLLGGIGIFFTLFVICVLYYFFAPRSWPTLTDLHVPVKHLFGLFLAALGLCIGGAIDDRYQLKPLQLVIAPLLAVIVVIAFGMGVDSITNPLTGKQVFLDQWNITLFWFAGLPRHLTLPADILTFLWLFGTMYTTKLLDGLDGLVSGITSIGALIIGIVSLFFFVNEPTALLSFIVAGAFAGFLGMNFNPAKMFLGEAGSTLAGFLLGTLAIISGAKFAIAMLVLGIPILDTAWVIFRRMIIEKRSPFKGDRKHLHFRMLDVGLSQRQTVLILYAVSALFGVSGLFLQSSQKIVALILVVVVMLGLVLLLHQRRRRSLS